MEWPGQFTAFNGPFVLSPFGPFGNVFEITRSNGGSQAWPAANRAIYMPVRCPINCVIDKAWWFNGATASGNVDVGIYSPAGTKIISTGATAQSGTSQVQSVDITDTVIGPGWFYLAIGLSSATGTIIMYDTGSTLLSKWAGIYTQASAVALPATATFATPAGGHMPKFGFNARPTV